MPKTELGYKHTVHLETVTPVAVGDGGTLSPSADYTLNPQNKQYAWLLDHKQFETWLSQNPVALTDYLNKVQLNAGKNRNTFLYEFLYDKKEVLSFFKGERTVVGNADTVELKTCIKDAGRPFIPGSTIKGAFKSVWLHNWLNANPVEINRIEEIILKTWDLYKSEIEHASTIINRKIGELLLAGFESLWITNDTNIREFRKLLNRIKPGNLKGFLSIIDEIDNLISVERAEDTDPFYDKSILENIYQKNSRMISEISGILQDALNRQDSIIKTGLNDIDQILSKCIDNNMSNPRRMQFSTLQVSDAYCNGDLKWYHTERFKLSEDKEMNLPLFFEAIEPMSEGSFSIMVESNKLVETSHRSIKTLEADSLVPFFVQVNQYALDNIKHELEMTQSEELWDYKQFLQKLKNDIQASDNQSAWLPIGFGKSNFYQSIGLFIRQHNKEVFEKYIKLFKMGRRPNPGETYQTELPLTRNLTIEGHLPLGWIMLYENTHDRSIPKAVEHFNQGDQIEATVVTIARPFSKIKIPGVDGLINMLGTKSAQQNPRFKEKAVVVVQIDVNKEEKITQTRFVRVK